MNCFSYLYDNLLEEIPSDAFPENNIVEELWVFICYAAIFSYFTFLKEKRQNPKNPYLKIVLHPMSFYRKYRYDPDPISAFLIC